MFYTFMPKRASAGVSTDTKYQRLYNNQFFDYLSEQLPKNHKEMFRWCEVVYHSNPSLVNGIRKMINYPLTEFIYKSDSSKVCKDTQELVEDILDIRSHLLALGLDYYIYGNVFRSIYFPFSRFLECALCHTEINIIDAKYKLKRGKFVLTCGECGNTRTAEIVDKPDNDLDNLKLISWSPKQIELFNNPITDTGTYYYKLSSEISKGIITGDKTIVATLPKVFLDAHEKNRVIEFGKNFKHIKAPSIAGFSSGWGVPPLASVLKLFLYQSILRKSVEAIGLEHITPKTILFPQASTNDPTLTSSLGRWKEQLTQAMEHWRMDPNYVMMAPYPTGVVNVGSQGRALMPTQEIRQADEDMVRALDIPIEFVFARSNINPSPVSLRLLENQLTPFLSQERDYVNWIIRCINAKYDKNFCMIDFTPFRLSDDAFRLQVLTQMAGSSVSQSTVLEAIGIKPEEERDRMRKERVRQMEDERRMETEARRIQNDIAAQAADDVHADETGEIPQYNQQKLIAMAQEQAMQFLQVPYEERRGLLAQLQNEDYVMYALVRSQMDQMRDQAQGAGGEAAPA